ncbi:MAG: TIGR03620 family F420-dependent LLM class oxidoreductase, partial [Thermoleophilaceae bacterium]
GAANKDAFAHAGILLGATDRIVVATGITNIYARDAFAMKTGAYALADAFPERFLLGIGVSHGPTVEARGHDYGKPLTTMRGYLDAMELVRYVPPPPPELPGLVLAALGPRMIELARERADGAHPYLVTPDHTARARGILGARPFLAPEQGFVLETDPDAARTIAREYLIGYLQLPNYLNSWREEGFGDDDFEHGGSDRLVDALIAWGDAGAVRARVRDHLHGGADHVALQPVTRDLGRAMEELRALAPALLDVAA